MPNTVRPFAAATESISLFQHLTRKTSEGLAQLLSLNVQTAQSVLNAQTQHWNQLLKVQRLDEWATLQAGLVQPLTHQASHYGQELYQIANNLGQEWNSQSQTPLAEVQTQWAKVQGNLNTVLKNMPMAAQTLTASMKNSLASANQAMGALQQVVSQASDAAQANVLAVAAQASQPNAA